MPGLLKISEAASLALHTMALLAADTTRTRSTRQMAQRLGVSEAHLAKVLQRLGRAGLVRSQRGPGGGFTLGKNSGDIALLEVYEVTDGPLDTGGCLFSKPRCNGSCILGGLVAKVATEARDYLANTTLDDLTHVFAK